MTRDEIMALEGRELDAAIAERVCGWRRVNGLLVSPSGGLAKPRYSTDLNACREAEELIVAHAHEGWCPCPAVEYGANLLGLVRIRGGLEDGEVADYMLAMADAATRCRAMLLALEAK